jgi:hypothetical protein
MTLPGLEFKLEENLCATTVLLGACLGEASGMMSDQESAFFDSRQAVKTQRWSTNRRTRVMSQRRFFLWVWPIVFRGS